jgi:two-component system, NtrC family, nitrogen regulation response regulator NtrX
MEWSGNVRELRNTVERLVIMTPGTQIDAGQIESGEPAARVEVDNLINRGGTFQEFKDRSEAAFIRKQLEDNNWNVSRTADVLDIQRSHLYNKMKKYGLTRGDEGYGGIP